MPCPYGIQRWLPGCTSRRRPTTKQPVIVTDLREYVSSWLGDKLKVAEREMREVNGSKREEGEEIQ
ncbi:UNVERIFIED_ORG: hypothetical protein EOZ59_2053 [Serratia quinivorans]